jgi:rsbT co-antagonist protein RsbR
MKIDLSKTLQRKKKQILEAWMTNQLKDDTLREGLDALLKAMNERTLANPHSEEFEVVNEILSGISITRARQGFTPRETGLFVFSLKDALQQIVQDEIKNDPQALYDASQKLNKLMDAFGVVTFETFIKGREEVILRQTDEITEISTPVIRIWDGILALPIIGTLDSARTQTVMENLLQEIVNTGCTIAILDISGVPTVDSLVAQHLIKTVAATRLMGAECIISGIRPEIAQTVVHLGIDLSNIVTKASLASALRHAFTMMKLDVKKAVQIKP